MRGEARGSRCQTDGLAFSNTLVLFLHPDTNTMNTTGGALNVCARTTPHPISMLKYERPPPSMFMTDWHVIDGGILGRRPGLAACCARAALATFGLFATRGAAACTVHRTGGQHGRQTSSNKFKQPHPGFTMGSARLKVQLNWEFRLH